ncbi:zinc ribbon domain-containing protein [Streptomyces sp. NPDC051133]|uniref:zinc ribbon domain-containing protein n=1 Tax=Streptomyces sp. NPDC051133 TaxID=3155521 RepID=UPI003424ACF9
MHFCVHCGVRIENAAQQVCPNCGAPYPAGRPAEPADGDSFVRVGATRLPTWLPWALAAVLVAGGVTLGVAFANRSDTSSAGDSPAGLVSPQTSYGGWSVTPTPYEDGSGTDEPYPGGTYSSDDGGPDTDTPGPAEETSQDSEDASTVVTSYYDLLNAGDYSAAWDMGGSNLFNGSYANWVAGFRTTAHVDVTTSDDGYGEVGVAIRATQTDGSVRSFTGTYSVQDGKIVGARIREGS